MSESVQDASSSDVVQQSMKMAYDGIVDEPLPPWMVSAITSSKRRMLINGALAAAVLSVGVILGMGLKSALSSGGPVVVAELGASDLGSQVHSLFSLDPVDPVQIKADDPAFLNLWVSHRLGRAFELPDLSVSGLTALGARMVQDGNRAAALSVFEDGEQNRFSLLARAGNSAAPTETMFSKSAGSKRLEWQQDDIVYALVSESDKEQLEAIKMHIVH